MKCILFFLVTVTIAGLATAHSYKSPLQLFHTERVSFNESNPVKLSVTPTLLNNSGEWVTVSYSNSHPNNSDFIAVYSPSNVNISLTSPIKYQWANVSKGYIDTGFGTIRFRLVNMYADYTFAFYGNGTEYPVFYGFSSQTVAFTNYEQPLQPHLALTSETNTMRLTWASGQATEQFAQWGSQSGVYDRQNQSNSYTYTAADLCGQPATTFGWRDPGMLHTVVLTFNTAEETIYYRFGSNETTWSEEFSFNTPVPVAASSGFKFVAYGDMGKGETDSSLEHWEEVPSINTTSNVAALVGDGSVDLVIHIGDIAYAVGYSAQWDEFLYQITPVASRVPYMTLPGNHERDFPKSGSIFNVTDSGGECGVPYEHRFPMPNSDHETQWYSFEFGNVHFTFMSTELDFSIKSPQWNFIVQDLQNVDRSKTPWVIFNGHRPMYIDSTSNTTHTGDTTVALLLQQSLEDVLVKYEVDLAFWGHHHSYQRTCPVANGVCYHGQQYPIHVVIGMAGMGLSKDLMDVPPVWIEVADDTEYGYTTIETTETTLHMQFFNNSNVLRDEFFLDKTLRNLM